MTSASWPSMTATHELVVPKSMPMTLAIVLSFRELVLLLRDCARFRGENV